MWLWLALPLGCLSSGSLSGLDVGQTVMVTPTPNLAADPNHAAHVFVQLQRDDGVPLAGAVVDIEAAGCEVQQPATVTSAAGVASAEIRCSQAGQRRVEAYLLLGAERRLLPPSLYLNVYSPTDAAGSLPTNQPLSVQAYADDGAHFDTSLRGAVRVECSDPAAVLPDDHDLTGAEGGAFMWPQAVLLRTPGMQTVDVRHLPTGRLLSSNSYEVTSQTASSLNIGIATSQPTAHLPVAVTVAAADPSGAPITDFAGTVRFRCSDARASLPEATAFLPGDRGERDFAVTFATPGAQQLHVSDAAGLLRPAELSSLQVGEGPAVALALEVVDAATQGDQLSLTLTPTDVDGRPTHNVVDAVHFGSSDAAAILPSDVALTGPTTLAGQLQLLTPGPQLLQVSSLSRPTLLAVEATIDVLPLDATHLQVAGPPSSVAGAPITLTITALGALDSVALGYSGTIALTSTDSAAEVLGTFTFGGGTGRATLPGAIVLTTAGLQTITAHDLASPAIAGTSAAVAVAGGTATQLRLELASGASVQSLVPLDVTLTAADAFNNPAPAFVGTPLLTCSDGNATLPADNRLRAADTGQRHFPGGLVLAASGTTHITASAPSLALATLSLQVAPGPAHRLQLWCNGPFFGGQSFVGESCDLRLTAFDTFGNVATSYRGNVVVSAGGAGMSPPRIQHTFSAADGGTAGFSMTPTQPQVTNFWAADSKNGELFAHYVVNTSSRPQNSYGADSRDARAVSASPTGSCFAPSLAWGSDLRPTVAWSDLRNGSQIYLLKYDGMGSWQALGGSNSGGAISGGIALNNDQVSLAIDPGQQTPAVAWRHADPLTGVGSIYYRAYSAASDAWLELGGSASGSGVDGQSGAQPQAPALAFAGGQPLIVWQSQSSASAAPVIRALSWNGSAWAAPGGAGRVDLGLGGASRGPRLAVDASGTANVAWANDGSGRSQIYLRQLVGGAWTGLAGSDSGEGVSASPGAASAVDLALSSAGTPWLAWLDDGRSSLAPGTGGDRLVRVKTTDGNSWFGMGGSDALVGVGGLLGDCQAPAITLDGSSGSGVATLVWTRTTYHEPVKLATSLQLRQLRAGQWAAVNGSDGCLGTDVAGGSWSAGPLLARLLSGSSGQVVIALQRDQFGGGNFNIQVVSWP